MNDVITLIIKAVILGSIYSLAALAFNLIFATIRIVNLAQGDFLAYGGVLFSLAAFTFHINGVVAFLISAVGVMLMALITFSLFVNPVLPGVLSRWTSESDNVRWVLSTLGVSVALEAIGSYIAPDGPLRAKPWIAGTLLINHVQIPMFDFVIVGVTVVLVAATFLFLQRTGMGRLLRALSVDRYLVAALGHSVVKMMASVFVVAGLLSAVAGMLIAPAAQADPESGFAFALYGFTAAVVGGFGDMRGALVGGVLVAAAQLFGSTYWNSGLYTILPLIILILTLMIRPSGLFGSRLVERV